MVRSDGMNGIEKTDKSPATYWVRDEEICVELISQQVLAIKKF